MPRPSNPHLKDDLLRAAVSLLSDRGSPSFSMRDLAKEVDYAVTAIYRVFQSRSDLLRAMQLSLFEQLQTDLFEDLDPMASPEDQLRDMGACFLSWGMKHPSAYHLMFHNTEADALLTPDEQALARSPLRGLEALLTYGNERGDWSIPDPESAALGLFSTLHGLLSLHLFGRLPPNAADPLTFYDAWANHWLTGVRQNTTVGPLP